MDELTKKFKSHIHFEEGMDDSLLSFYLDMAKNYVMTLFCQDNLPYLRPIAFESP